MPDPNARRDSALSELVKTQQRLVKVFEAMNINLTEIAKRYVNVKDAQAVESHDQCTKAVCLMDEPPFRANCPVRDKEYNDWSHEDCSAAGCKVARKDVEFDPMDCPKRTPVTDSDVKINYMVIPVTESAAMTAREIGYNAGYDVHNACYFIQLPFTENMRKASSSGTS